MQGCRRTEAGAAPTSQHRSRGANAVPVLGPERVISKREKEKMVSSIHLPDNVQGSAEDDDWLLDKSLMVASWGRSIEQVLLVAAERKIRVLGVVSPDSNSGVTPLCRQLADASQAAGWRTLLANFSQPTEAGSEDGWHPGEGAPKIVQSNRHAYDLLRVRSSAQTRSLFNNVEGLQQTFADDLKTYERIIVDLPPVLDWTSDMPNPVAAARACDSVVLVCMAARITKGRVRSALSALDAVSVRLDGLIINDHYNPSLGERVAATAQKLTWLPQRLTGWIGGKATASDTLNTPL